MAWADDVCIAVLKQQDMSEHDRTDGLPAEPQHSMLCHIHKSQRICHVQFQVPDINACAMCVQMMSAMGGMGGMGGAGAADDGELQFKHACFGSSKLFSLSPGKSCWWCTILMQLRHVTAQSWTAQGHDDV